MAQGRGASGFVVIGLILIARTDGQAMQVIIQPPVAICLASSHGVWDGPWDLASSINPPGELLWGEIAHAFLLPPPNDAHVLFMCQRYANDPDPCSFVSAEAFLWDPANPSDLELTIVVPQAVAASTDPFCGGQAFTSDGKPLIAGGTNILADCQDGHEMDPPRGHTELWWFDNVEYIRGVSEPMFHETSDFTNERWYPTLLQTGDDRHVVIGNFPEPDSMFPLQQMSRTRQYGSWDALTPSMNWESTATHFYNYELPAGGCAASLPVPIVLGDYVRVHQLANNYVINVRN